jgi:biopolymer transport protein ExbB
MFGRDCVSEVSRLSLNVFTNQRKDPRGPCVSSDMHSTFADAVVRLPLFQSIWVFWLMIGLSVLSLAVAVERWLFLRARHVDAQELETRTAACPDDAEAMRAALGDDDDSLEHAVIAAALQHFTRGRAAMLHAVASRMVRQRARYESRLIVLATVAANAPFIGLFGTVLGVIRAFQDLSSNISQANTAVMAGVAEALVSTAVGLLVAIPAVVAYNALKARVKGAAQTATSITEALCARASAP